jgi:hypothetical protein
MFSRLEPKFRTYWGSITSLGTASWERWLDTDRHVLAIAIDNVLLLGFDSHRYCG